jgi:hypothetical protein
MKSTAQRRRSKAQIKEDKAKEIKQKEEIQAKLLAWDDLEAELEKKISENKKLTEVNSIIGGMVENGVIKQVGEREFEAVVDPEERSHIQSKRRS